MKTVIGLLCAVAIALFLAFRHSPDAEQSRLIATPDEAAAEAAQAPHETNETAAEMRSAVANQSASIAQAADPVQAFQMATDLLAFVQQWEADAPHDRRAATAVAMALEACALLSAIGVARFSAGFDPSMPDHPARQQALVRHLARCEPLIAARSGLAERAKELFASAAAAGEPQARAWMLRERAKEQLLEQAVSGHRHPSPADPQQRTALATELLEILLSKDPHAILTIGDVAPGHYAGLFAPGSPVDAFFGSPYSSLLLACHLGLDCSANGAFLRDACVGLMPCGYGSVEQYLRMNLLPPNVYESVDRLAREMAAHIGSGNAEGLVRGKTKP